MSMLIKHLDLPPTDEYIHLAINSKGEVYDDGDYMDDLDFNPKPITPITYAKEVSDVEPVRHGHWIFRFNSLHLDWRRFECFECSVCRMNRIRRTGEILNYCPYCGAKMDGKEQEHE